MEFLIWNNDMVVSGVVLVTTLIAIFTEGIQGVDPILAQYRVNLKILVIYSTAYYLKSGRMVELPDCEIKIVISSHLGAALRRAFSGMALYGWYFAIRVCSERPSTAIQEL